LTWINPRHHATSGNGSAGSNGRQRIWWRRQKVPAIRAVV